MNRRLRRLRVGAAIAIAPAAAAALLHAQAREWTTANGDAQRNAWVRAADPRLTKAAVEKGEVKFLWKMKLDGETRQLNALTPPVLLDRLISHRGFKALAFVGTSNERIFAIDTDLNRIYWEHVINYSSIAPPANSSWACPGGLTAAFTRPTVAAPPAFGAGRGGGGRSGSSVGEPGRGAPSLQLAGPGRGRANDPTPPAAGRGTAPVAPAAPQGRGAPSPGNGGGPTENVFVLASDGLVRALNTHNGTERFPALPFLPANARPGALILVDGVLYTTTSNGCGAVPNGVYALDLDADQPKTVRWGSGGPSVAGAAGVAVGTDGTIYAAIAESSAGSALPGSGKETSYPSTVVALEPKTLKLKGWFTAPGADFNATPVVIRHNNRDLVVVTANDGRMYLLDGTALGGSDHKTPLHVTAKYTAAGIAEGLATWDDQGTRWILAPMTSMSAADAGSAPPKQPASRSKAAGGIVAFKLVDQGGALTLERTWVSRDMTSPLTPVIFSGVVFAVSSGEYRAGSDAKTTAAQRVKASVPAVLYALDPATGKELWNSGKSITSFARGGLAASAGQVYLVTYDNTLYAFGVPMEH